MKGFFQGLIIGALLIILLPVMAMFVAIPLGLIMLLIVIAFFVTILLYVFTKSTMLAMIMWSVIGFFVGFMIGIFVLVAVGMIDMEPIGLVILPMLLMAKNPNPLRIKARNRTHARKKATVALGRNQRIVKVRPPTKSSDKYRVYHKEKRK